MLYHHCTHSILPLQVQQADELQESIQAITDGLYGLYYAEQNQKTISIQSEVEVVKEQLEAHKVGYIANCHSKVTKSFLIGNKRM